MLKKVLCTTVLVSAFMGGAAYAEESSNSSGMFLSVKGGLALPLKTKDAISNQSTKVKSSGLVNVGVGYSIDENSRVALEYEQLFGTKMTRSYGDNFYGVATSAEMPTDTYLDLAITKSQNKISARALMVRGYYDLFQVTDGMKVYATAGVGLAQVFSKTSFTSKVYYTAADDVVTSSGTARNLSLKSGKKTGLAYSIGAGVTYQLANSVNMDLGYNFTSYGKTKTVAGVITSDYTGHTTETFAVTAKSKSVKAHAVTLGLRFAL